MYHMGRYGELENNPSVTSFIEELKATPVYMHLLAGWERITMLVIHAAFSLLTMYAAKRGRLSLLVLSFVRRENLLEGHHFVQAFFRQQIILVRIGSPHRHLVFFF